MNELAHTHNEWQSIDDYDDPFDGCWLDSFKKNAGLIGQKKQHSFWVIYGTWHVQSYNEHTHTFQLYVQVII